MRHFQTPRPSHCSLVASLITSDYIINDSVHSWQRLWNACLLELASPKVLRKYFGVNPRNRVLPSLRSEYSLGNSKNFPPIHVELLDPAKSHVWGPLLVGCSRLRFNRPEHIDREMMKEKITYEQTYVALSFAPSFLSSINDAISWQCLMMG